MADIYVSPDLLVGSVTQYGTPVSTQTHLTMEADSAFSAGSIQHNPTIIAEAVPTPVTVSADLLPAVADQYGTPISTQTHLIMEASAAQPAKAVQYEPTISVEVNASGDAGVTPAEFSAIAVQYEPTVSTTSAVSVTVSADLLVGNAAQAATFDGCDLTLGLDQLVGGGVLCTPTIVTNVSVSTSVDCLSAIADQRTPTITAVNNDVAVTVAADCFSAAAVQRDPTIATIRRVTVAADLLTSNAVQYVPAIISAGVVLIEVDRLTAQGDIYVPTASVFKNALVDVDPLAGGAKLDEPTESAIRIVTVAVDSLVASGGQRECTPIILWAVGALSVRATWLKPNLTFTATKPDIEYSESRPEVTFTGSK